MLSIGLTALLQGRPPATWPVNISLLMVVITVPVVGGMSGKTSLKPKLSIDYYVAHICICALT